MNRYKIEHMIFKPISKFKKCGSCFRCIQKGKCGGFWDYSVKPKNNEVIRCTSINSPEVIELHTKACEWYEPRWYWNLRIWWQRVSYVVKRMWEINIRTKIGALRKPVKLDYIDSYDYITDSVIPDSEPRCPYCGEFPYSDSQCVFCGQRFIQKIRGKYREN